MLSERLGHIFDKPLEGFARRIPVSPNTLSITGFLITCSGSYILISDLRSGGLLILAGAVFDLLDGIVARTQGRATLFGAFLDSVLDRYSDAAMMMGLGLHFLYRGNHPETVLCMGVLVGAFLISYTRARAEGLGQRCNYGLMERTERIVLLTFGTVTGILLPVLWGLLVLTHFTALQRIVYVWKETRQRV